DLREPLRGIRNYATFLIEDYGDKLDGEGRAKLQTMQRLSLRLDNLLDSLLQFSRVGHVELAVQETHLPDLGHEGMDSLRISLQEQNVTVRITERLPVVRCDRVRVAEIFRNLIANAIKYNDKSDKWIEVGVDADAHAASDSSSPSEPGRPDNPVFYVRDNG